MNLREALKHGHLFKLVYDNFVLPTYERNFENIGCPSYAIEECLKDGQALWDYYKLSELSEIQLHNVLCKIQKGTYVHQ